MSCNFLYKNVTSCVSLLQAQGTSGKELHDDTSNIQYFTDHESVASATDLSIWNSANEKGILTQWKFKNESCHSASTATMKEGTECSICQKVFSHKRSLYDHNRGVHGIGLPFKCLPCGKMFSSRRTLNRHKLSCTAVVGIEQSKDKAVDEPLNAKDMKDTSYNTDDTSTNENMYI